MKYISAFGKKLEHLCRDYFPRKQLLITICNSLKSSLANLFHYMVFHVKPFWLHVGYFLLVSVVGYLALKASKPRTNYKPSDLDLFFTSVSATTVSSMSIVEMEVFSNDQLIVMTILMFLGGEVFTSFLRLQLQRFKLSLSQEILNSSNITKDQLSSQIEGEQQVIELSIITYPPTKSLNTNGGGDYHEGNNNIMRYHTIKSLGYVVLGYLLVVIVIGSSLISLYISLSKSANNELKTKGLVLQTFSIFTTVSTFANCGFLPTNENILVFRKNSGLLLILIPQILLGNTLYPPCLRLVIYVLERFTKRKEYSYMLTNYEDLGYNHLMSSKESWLLSFTAIGFLLVQFVMFTVMEWSSKAMEGMNSYEKFVGFVFQTTNTRHTGESIVDFSVVSSAILVLFVVMMYLPSYTSFLPIGDQQAKASESNNKGSKRNITENMLFSQLSYLVIFVFVICITESENLKHDPLNFNVLSIVFEVTSAYGNVGYSMGYSCKRRLKLDQICEDKWYGFAGRWSKGGKVVLIALMFVGRLKKFSLHGGKAWRLS